MLQNRLSTHFTGSVRSVAKYSNKSQAESGVVSAAQSTGKYGGTHIRKRCRVMFPLPSVATVGSHLWHIAVRIESIVVTHATRLRAFRKGVRMTAEQMKAEVLYQKSSTGSDNSDENHDHGNGKDLLVVLFCDKYHEEYSGYK